MRHLRTDVLQDMRALSALSGHPLRSGLTLVVKVSPTAVGLLSVEGVQEEAEEENVVVQMPFSEAKEHLRWRTRPLPRT